MDDWLTDFTKPAVAVALIAVIVQGVKASVDLVGQALGRRISRQQSEIAHVTALLRLIDDLPIEPGGRILLKLKAVRMLPGGLPSFLREAIDGMGGKDP